jgi:hypothetical protein
MKREIKKIATQNVDMYGHDCRVSGVWDDKDFDVLISIEYDGRDLESECVEGDYNPVEDWEGPAPDFFSTLCEDERFVKLHNEGHKKYEEIWRKIQEEAAQAS